MYSKVQHIQLTPASLQEPNLVLKVEVSKGWDVLSPSYQLDSTGSNTSEETIKLDNVGVSTFCVGIPHALAVICQNIRDLEVEITARSGRWAVGCSVGLLCVIRDRSVNAWVWRRPVSGRARKLAAFDAGR